MQDLTNEILELIRRTSTDLPPDVEERIRAAVEKEAPVRRHAARSRRSSGTSNSRARIPAPSARIPARPFFTSSTRLAGAHLN